MKKIKKTFLPFTLMVLFLIFVTGCSMGMNSSSINPSSWIIGTWSDNTDTMCFVFSSDNVIQESTGLRIDFKEALEAESSVTYNETSNATTYSINMNDSSGAGTYTFTKTSNTTLDYTISSSGITVGPIELTKE